MNDGERIGLDDDELPRAAAAVQYIADRRLLSRIARLERESGAMVRPPEVKLYAGELPNHLDPADWRAGYLAVREIELPPQLYADIHENAPQALLRDLYRPVPEAFVWHEREVAVELDFAGTRALAEARAAQKRDPLPEVQPLGPELREHAQKWRTFVRERWKPHLDDSEPRRSVWLPREPSLAW